MRILMIASEATPFAKTGGLADVVGALPRALARLGHTVDVFIPRYQGIAAGERVGTVAVRDQGQLVNADISRHAEGPTSVMLVAHPDYYDRPHLYGPDSQDYDDNPARFTFLVRAALGWGARSREAYAVVHAHDWQAGLTPVLLRDEYSTAPPFRDTAVVFTIHNMAYQGLCDASWAPRLGLRAALMGPSGIEYWGRISFLKAGIVFSDLITTVSPGYAREIQTPEFGFGLDGVLRHRSADVVGILNGIDYDQWDPARDPNLPTPYDAVNLDGKAAAKQGVLAAFGLPVGKSGRRRPLAAMISRMVDQKGLDLLAAAGDGLSKIDASFVVLGTGERRYEEFWRDLAARHPRQFGVKIGFDEAMAHRIEGGADLFLMPSRFEPCGLNQMYSLRYGTVPLVRATGGLADTVQPFDASTGRGTGFTFREYSTDALLSTLRLAVSTYRDAVVWRQLQGAGMRQDFSWDASARVYTGVYERAVARKLAKDTTRESHGIRQAEDAD